MQGAVLCGKRTAQHKSAMHEHSQPVTEHPHTPTFTPTQFPTASEVRSILEDPAADSLDSSTSNFWLLVAALKRFLVSELGVVMLLAGKALFWREKGQHNTGLWRCVEKGVVSCGVSLTLAFTGLRAGLLFTCSTPHLVLMHVIAAAAGSFLTSQPNAGR